MDPKPQDEPALRPDAAVAEPAAPALDLRKVAHVDAVVFLGADAPEAEGAADADADAGADVAGADAVEEAAEAPVVARSPFILGLQQIQQAVQRMKPDPAVAAEIKRIADRVEGEQDADDAMLKLVAEATDRIAGRLEAQTDVSREIAGAVQTLRQEVHNVAAAVRDSSGETSIVGGAILTIAAGSNGGWARKTPEGAWFVIAGYRDLRAAIADDEDNFIAKMLGAADDEMAAQSKLVQSATDFDLRFIRAAGAAALAAIDERDQPAPG